MKGNTWEKELKKMEKMLTAPEGFRFELINSLHSKYIIKWRNDPSINQYFFSQEKFTEEKQCKFLENYFDKDRLDFALINIEKNLPIGIFSIKNFSKKPELGKMIGEMEFRGKGIAKKATICLLKYAFNKLSMNAIIAKTQKSNIVNINLNKKLGYKIIGEEVVENVEYYTSRYKNIDIPALVIWGKDDSALPVSSAYKLSEELQNSTLRIIDKCGHIPQEEYPRKTAEEINKFMQSLKKDLTL